MTLEYELLLSMAFSCFLHEKEVGGEGKRKTVGPSNSFRENTVVRILGADKTITRREEEKRIASSWTMHPSFQGS